jgi:hypothetical protein
MNDFDNSLHFLDVIFCSTEICVLVKQKYLTTLIDLKTTLNDFFNFLFLQQSLCKLILHLNSKEKPIKRREKGID